MPSLIIGLVANVVEHFFGSRFTAGRRVRVRLNRRRSPGFIARSPGLSRRCSRMGGGSGAETGLEGGADAMLDSGGRRVGLPLTSVRRYGSRRRGRRRCPSASRLGQTLVVVKEPTRLAWRQSAGVG